MLDSAVVNKLGCDLGCGTVQQKSQTGGRCEREAEYFLDKTIPARLDINIMTSGVHTENLKRYA